MAGKERGLGNRLPLQSLNSLSQNFASQHPVWNAALTSDLLQLGNQIRFQLQGYLCQVPFLLTLPQAQHESVLWSFQKVHNFYSLPKFSLFVLAAEIGNHFPLSLRHGLFSLLPFEAAQLLFASRFIGGDDAKSIRFFHRHDDHQPSSKLCPSESDVTAFASRRRIGALDGWLRFQGFKDFVPTHPVLPFHVFLCFLCRVNSPDALPQAPPPTVATRCRLNCALFARHGQLASFVTSFVRRRIGRR